MLSRIRELPAATLVMDVEPLVAYWDSGQEALDQGIASVLRQLADASGADVVYFATNSARRPSAGRSLARHSSAGRLSAGRLSAGRLSAGRLSAERSLALPGREDLRVMYLSSARKPLRTSPYLALPRPGVVIGDQIATDGVLARRLGYTFLHYRPRPPSLSS